MVRGFNSYGMEIIQGAPLFWFYLAKHVQTSTPRTLSTLSETREFQYMKTYGFAQFLFLVCISYSIVAPFVLFSTVIIFSFGYIIMKYQLFYVYQTKKEGGGEWWPIAFGLLCISIAFFQIVTFFSLATIAGVDTPPAIYVTVLPVVTGVFWYACVRYYTPKTRFVKRSRSILETKTTECAIVDPVMNQELFKVWLDEPYESEWQKCQSDSDSDSATLGQ